MASYRGHLAFSVTLAGAYGGVAAYYTPLDWGTVFLGAGLTAIGGLLPDLDSDSGVPVRELFGFAAAFLPLLLIDRLRETGLTTNQIIVILAGLYLFIRYGVSAGFKRLTAHRGMFHSVPAMVLTGLVVFLVHPGMLGVRLYLATGVMLGFLSHLLLDDLSGFDLFGRKPRLGKYAGNSLKMYSGSLPATLVVWGLVALLGYVAWVDFNG